MRLVSVRFLVPSARPGPARPGPRGASDLTALAGQARLPGRSEGLRRLGIPAGPCLTHTPIRGSHIPRRSLTCIATGVRRGGEEILRVWVWGNDPSPLHLILPPSLSLTRSLTHSLPHSPTHSLHCPLPPSPARPLAQSPIRPTRTTSSLHLPLSPHSLTRSLTHSLIHSLATHGLTADPDRHS